MKKLHYLLWFVFIIAATTADGQGITFRDLTFEQAIKTSAKENKPVFLHGFASWCHYCEYMKDSVYTIPAVGEFYNKNFINIRMDLEREGKTLNNNLLKVSSFPALVVFD